MHRLGIFIAGIILMLPAAASADQTATYKGDDGRDMLLEIADSGSVRISGPEKGQNAIIIDNVLYLVGEENGKMRVMRLTDLAAAMEQAIGPLFKGLFEAAANDTFAKKDEGIGIERAGLRSIGGREGRVYRITGLDDSKPGEAVEWVVSEDASLKPFGATMQRFIEATLVMAAPFLGSMVTEIVGEMRQVFALGTPLKVPGKFELASVTSGPIDAKRFELPAKPESLEAIIKEMKANQPTD